MVLNEEVCQWLLALFDQSGLKQRYWGDLPKAARMKMAPLLKKQASDWTGLYFRRLPLDIVWAKLDLPEPEQASKDLSLSALAPPVLLVELMALMVVCLLVTAKLHRDLTITLNALARSGIESLF